LATWTWPTAGYLVVFCYASALGAVQDLPPGMQTRDRSTAPHRGAWHSITSEVLRAGAARRLSLARKLPDWPTGIPDLYDSVQYDHVSYDRVYIRKLFSLICSGQSDRGPPSIRGHIAPISATGRHNEWGKSGYHTKLGPRARVLFTSSLVEIESIWLGLSSSQVIR
jgi:hypothetical protein